MNRAIKYRAWDLVKKRMWWNVQDAYDTLGIHHREDGDTSDHRGFEDDFGPRSFGDALTDANLIVEQFTGLYDKNGKEIYEGDIVRTNVVRGYFGRKAKKNQVGPVEWSSSGCWGFAGWVCSYCNSVEIVGNIHEKL